MYQLANNNSTDRFTWDAEAEQAYWQSREKAAHSAVAEISLPEFMDAIAVMYPIDWQGDSFAESFKLAEMYCGNVTYIYAKVGEKYFTFRDAVTLSHAEIVARITQEVRAKNTVVQM